jgi:hypothetical protein
MTKKQLKRYGGSLVITFDSEEQEWFNIKEGDWIDIGDIVKIKPKFKNTIKDIKKGVIK